MCPVYNLITIRNIYGIIELESKNSVCSKTNDLIVRMYHMFTGIQCIYEYPYINNSDIDVRMLLPSSAGNIDSRSSSFVTPPQKLDGNFAIPKIPFILWI